VVCDGVSSAPDSDLASLAAARAARDVLAGPELAGALASPDADRGPMFARGIEAAGLAAHEAASAVARRVAGEGRGNPPSTTFVAAVLAARRLVVGSVGTAGLLDPGRRRAGSAVDRRLVGGGGDGAGPASEEAESGPNAHAITRWLGADAPDPKPRTVERQLGGAGWCCCAQTACGTTARRRPISPRSWRSGRRPWHRRTWGTGDSGPLATALVAWAVEAGGADNISVALARVEN
jgi:hypothetical protein